MRASRFEREEEGREKEGRKKENLWIILATGRATSGAWESPIVLAHHSTLLFSSFVGRTTLYIRPPNAAAAAHYSQ